MVLSVTCWVGAVCFRIIISLFGRVGAGIVLAVDCCSLGYRLCLYRRNGKLLRTSSKVFKELLVEPLQLVLHLLWQRFRSLTEWVASDRWTRFDYSLLVEIRKWSNVFLLLEKRPMFVSNRTCHAKFDICMAMHVIHTSPLVCKLVSAILYSSTYMYVYHSLQF